MNERPGDEHRRTFTEEIEIAGSQLVEWIQNLLKDGNVRQIRIMAPGGQILLEAPMTVGVIGGGAVVLAAPWLAILGALAGLVAHVKIEVVRTDEAGDEEAARTPEDRGKTHDA